VEQWFLWNVGNCLHDHMMSQPRKPWSATSPPWEPQISDVFNPYPASEVMRVLLDLWLTNVTRCLEIGFCLRTNSYMYVCVCVHVRVCARLCVL
jgi:hypothetical protein